MASTPSGAGADTPRPAQVDADQSLVFEQLSVGDLLSRAVVAVPERAALIAPGPDGSEQTWTYHELDVAARRVAAALLSVFTPGDRVATLTGSSAHVIELHLGAALAGLTLVTLNPASRPAEVEYLLRQSDTRGLFADETYRGNDNRALVAQVWPRLEGLTTVLWTNEWDTFVADAVPGELPTVDPDAPALILFTSGTTGKPKGVVLTHASIVNNALITSSLYGLPDGVAWLNALPMFHVSGSVAVMLACIARLGTQVLLTAFDADRALVAMADHHVRVALAVPTMLVAMLESPEVSVVDLSSLDIVVTGGAVVAPELVRRISDALHVETMVMFGQTETGGTVTVTRRGDPVELVTATIGAPVPLTDCKIIDAATGATLLRGESGEICVRSPCLMRGYFAMPERTVETIDTDGWVHTGDLGRMLDNGYVQITGRLKDMIIRGGENIYPRQIEDTLAEHPAVAQATVFGVPDERYGEQVAAAVVLRAGATTDVAELTTFVADRLARHLVPRHWQFLDELPLTASGKVQKFMLLERFENG